MMRLSIVTGSGVFSTPGLFDTYNEILDNSTVKPDPQLRGSLYTSADTNADEEAGLHKLAQKTGLPVESLRADRGAEARRQAAAQVSESLPPATAVFLSNPENAAVAHDDAERLAELENAARNGFGSRGPVSTLTFAGKGDQAAAQKAREYMGAVLGGFKSSVPSFNQGLAETGRIAMEATGWGTALRSLSDLTGNETWKNIAEAPRLAELYWESLANEARVKTKAGTLSDYLQQASGSLGTSLMAAPFGMAGEGAALGIFGLSATGGQEDMTRAGYSEMQAANVSIPKKIMEGLTEKIGLDALYKGGKPLVRAMTEFVLGDLAGEEINTVYNAIADKVTVRPNMTWNDLGQEVVDTAIITGLMGGMHGAAFHGSARVADYLHADFEASRRARATVDFMETLGDATKNSKTFQRMPEKLRDIIGQVTAEGPVENVYVPAAKVRELFQGKVAEADALVASMLDDPESYYQALAVGGDVVIPLPEYVEKWAGTEYHQALVDDIRLHPGDMSKRELDAWDKEKPAKVQEMLKSLDEEGTAPAADKKVFDAVLGELLGAGRERSTAEREALLWQSRYRTRAERLGRDAWDLYQENPVKIARPMPAFMTRRDFVDTSIDPFLDRLRAGDVPTDSDVYGTSLVEFLREKGLQDEGGELSSLGADEGRKPFQKKLAQVDGISLDRAGELATEAGYFAERPTVRDLLDAIDGELRGKPVYSMQVQNEDAHGLRSDLDQLRQYLDSVGLDVGTMTNVEIRQVLKEKRFNQGGVSLVTLNGDELGEHGEIKDLRLAAVRWYRENLQGKVTAHREDLGDIRFTRTGRKEMAHFSADTDKLKLVPALLQVIEAGAYVREEVPDHERRDGIVKFHVIDGVVTLAGREMNIRIEIGEDKAGNKFYDLFPDAGDHEKKKASKQHSGSTSPGEPGGNPEGGSTTFKQSIPQKASGINISFAEGNRGSITFGPGFRNIALLEKADLSTFLHESGHAFLEELVQDAAPEGAPEQLVEDLGKLLKWWGIESPAEIGVEHHEQFARALEAYLMEGKAPSVELQSAFQRFKAWLLRIYRSAAGLDVKLNDEVRGVLDRLLATDEEIRHAEDLQGFHPLFTDAAAAGMTEREFQAYRQTVEKAHDEAETKLQQKLMKELTREQQKWWKDEREKVSAEVETEAKADPVYQAFQVLTNGKDFEGNAAPEGMKLSKADIVRMYGKEFVKKLPRAFRFTYTTVGGLHPDAVAEVFGFSSGDELLRSMANAPPMKKFIEAETDVRMRQTYGDMLNDGTIADEALKAIHSDYQGQVLQAELRALKRKQREVSPFVKAEKKAGEDALRREREEREYERRWLDAEKKLAIQIERGAKEEELRRLREEIRTNKEATLKARREMWEGIPPLDAFKVWAAQSIGAKPIRTIIPSIYSRAEQKAGKAAFEAAAKGDFEKAGQEKQNQILNHYLFLEASAAVEDAEKIRDYAARLEKPAAQERIGKAGGYYLNQVNGLLERYEFKKVSAEMLAQRQSLLEWAKQQEEMGLEPAIPEELLLDAGRRNYKTLTIDELRGVRDAIKNIEHLSREANRIRIMGEEMEMEEALAELTSSVTAHFDPRRIPIDKETRSWIERQKEKLSRFDASLIKTEQLIEWMDGGAIDGPWSRMIFQPIAAAEAREHDLTVDYTAKLAEIFERYGKEKREGMMDKIFIPSLGESLTRQAIVAAALNTGNESNRTKLLDGYGWVDHHLDEILGHLDGEDWAFVQEVWDTIEGLWPEIAALDKRLTGVEPLKVQAREIENQHGTFRGGYFPVVYDPLHSAAGEKQTDAKGDKLFESTYVRATTEKGHTRARIEEAAYPILLNLEVIPQHIAQVIHDITHREAVVTANRLLNKAEMREILNTTISAPYYKMLKLWLATVANDRNVDRTGNEFWTRFASGLRTNATIVGMGFRFTTMFSQIAGLSQSLDMVKPKYLSLAFLRFMRHPVEALDWVGEKSGEMRHRRGNLDRDIRDGIRKLQGKHDLKHWVQAKAFAGVGLFDAIVAVPTWMGAYEQAKAEGLSEGDAVQAADRAVRLSQGSGGTKDLAAVQRSNDMMKLFTMFYSYFSVLYNRLRNMGRLKRMGEIGFMDVAYKSLVMVMVPAVLGDLLAGRGPGDDDDPAWWALRKMLIYPFLTVPFLRDVMNSFDSGRPYTLTPMSRLFEMVAKLPAEVQSVKDNKRDFSDLVFQNFDLPGYAYGLPTGQVRTTSKYLWDLMEGDVEAEWFGDVLKGLLFGNKKEGGKR